MYFKSFLEKNMYRTQQAKDLKSDSNKMKGLFGRFPLLGRHSN